MTWSLLAAAGDAIGGLPSLSVYGIAAFPIALLLYALKWQNTQMSLKDEALSKLNDRLLAQGDLALQQAEKLAPLISDASRVLNQAIQELAPQQRRLYDDGGGRHSSSEERPR